MKPIETHYKGYRFRSRLEARWAVFFDALQIPYEYEKEGYRMGRVWYLPDFWLSQQDCWVEIKGKEPEEQELERVRKLVEATKKDVYLFLGQIPLPNVGDEFMAENGVQGYFWYEEYGKVTDAQISYWWCECPICGMVGLCYGGWTERLSCQHIKIKTPNIASPRLIAAYTAARSVRFEKGEKP